MKTLKPNDLGNKLLVENCQQIKMQDILKSSKGEIKKALITSQIEAIGVQIELATSRTYNNGVRFWLKCPQCQTRRGVLYKHPISDEIGCRDCLNLEYRKRKYKGMIEGKLA